jgi:hypothetical protein
MALIFLLDNYLRAAQSQLSENKRTKTTNKCLLIDLISFMENRPPPLPSPTRPQKSFYHYAATYCLLAPFTAIAVNIFVHVATIDTPPTTRIEALVPLIFPILIILSGVIFGIISLFGIRKYGRAGILWQAVAGILIVVFLALAAIPNVVRAREKSRQRYEQIYGHPPA